MKKEEEITMVEWKEQNHDAIIGKIKEAFKNANKNQKVADILFNHLNVGEAYESKDLAKVDDAIKKLKNDIEKCKQSATSLSKITLLPKDESTLISKICEVFENDFGLKKDEKNNAHDQNDVNRAIDKILSYPDIITQLKNNGYLNIEQVDEVIDRLKKVGALKTGSDSNVLQKVASKVLTRQEKSVRELSNRINSNNTTEEYKDSKFQKRMRRKLRLFRRVANLAEKVGTLGARQRKIIVNEDLVQLNQQLVNDVFSDESWDQTIGSKLKAAKEQQTNTENNEQQIDNEGNEQQINTPKQDPVAAIFNDRFFNENNPFDNSSTTIKIALGERRKAIVDMPQKLEGLKSSRKYRRIYKKSLRRIRKIDEEYLSKDFLDALYNPYFNARKKLIGANRLVDLTRIVNFGSEITELLDNKTFEENSKTRK